MKSFLVKHRYKVFLSLCAILFFLDLYSTKLGLSVGAEETNAFFNYYLDAFGECAYLLGYASVFATTLFIYSMLKVHRWLWTKYPQKCLYAILGHRHKSIIEALYSVLFIGIIVVRTLIIHNNISVYLELIS